jgi:hypothetical protein
MTGRWVAVASSWPRLLVAGAAMGLSRVLLGAAEACRWAPGLGLGLLDASEACSRFARRMLRRQDEKPLS